MELNKSTVKVSGALTAGGDIEALKDVHIAGGLTISGTFAPGLISSSSPSKRVIKCVGETQDVSGATFLADSYPLLRLSKHPMNYELARTYPFQVIFNASFSGDANLLMM